MLRFAWTAALLLCVSCADPLPPVSSEPLGYPVSLSYAAAPVMLRAEQPEEMELASYIQHKVPNWGYRPQSPELLAFAIRTLAMDFDLDARLLTAMIAQESAFDARAVSPTGAVGLTQLTVIGISEFLDQSGVVYAHLGNRVYAGSGTAYFQEAILKHWTTFPVSRELEDFAARTAWARSCKERIFSKPDQYGAQIIAGATILKAAIGYVCARSSRCTPATMGQAEWVRAGLERYNGDDTPRADGEPTKVYYARKIMAAVEAMRF
ncbi:transglycosylase SLT domain-containing protein [Oligoflexus tunisiensis]|uniref:transglycosylase SLT domain-containing protein n=1 Tax=Oligoflexus tunisiensis TaxID=708132 RepID=UPI001C406A11|nr:transglycosylase SLT domain-containing protein [Oligoflexus tunisiensis]